MEIFLTTIEKIVNQKPWVYATSYFGNIILFSGIYFFLFSDCFVDKMDLNYLKMLYFSIVTITTLGYGDIIPNLDTNSLLLIIIIQVLSGVILIGLFLNSLSQKLSDLKDEKLKKEQNEKEKLILTKQYQLLKPIIESHLKILSEMYTLTVINNIKNKNYHISPKELFDEEYIDNICTINLFSEKKFLENGDIKKGFLCEYLIVENDKFIKKIDDYLMKFSSNLPIYMVEKLIKIQDTFFIKFPKDEFEFYKNFKDDEIAPTSALKIGFTMEHSDSSFDLPNDEKSVKIHHELLLSIIEDIDKLLVEKIQMFVRLNSDYPWIGTSVLKVK